jgi:PTS system ascorbate-specific IIC component
MSALLSLFTSLSKIMDQPALFLGSVALLGLLLQRKSAREVIEGTVHAVLGLVIFQAGAGLLVGGIGPITDLMRKGWGATGVYPFNEPAFFYLMNLMAHTIVPTFLLGWLLHLLLVRLLPWFHCVFLTVHIMFYTATISNIGLGGAFGLSGWPLILASAVLCAVFWTVMPQWTFRYSRQFAGDDFTLAHHAHVGVFIASWIGKLFDKAKEEDADNLKLPGVLEIFRDATINTAITMPVFFLIIGLSAGLSTVQAAAGTEPWWMYLVLQGLQFSAGVTVLLFGVHQFLDAITAAFKGFSQTLLPGAIPALDMPVFFPYSPMGMLLGFVGGAIGSILVSVALLLVKSPLFVFPSLIMAFFESGIEGVFANKFGGWKAALVAGFVGSLFFSLGVLWLQPLTPQLDGTGAQFANIDTMVVLAPLFYLARAVGGVLGVAVPLG